jgi:hypothetical protein
MWTRFRLWLLTRLAFDPRGVFRFFDGRRWRTVDPLTTARAFLSHPKFDWDETPQLLVVPRATEQLTTVQVIDAAVREVFQIPPFAAGGLTELECVDLLSKFRQYLGNVKKNGSLFPISPVSMESEPSDEVTIPPRPGSASGSTPIEPLPAQPGSIPEPISIG